MKSIRTSLMAGSLLIGVAGLTLAQTAPDVPGSQPRAERMEKMHAKMGERHTKHLAELKAKLKLETGQESAWTAFEQSMQAPAKTMKHPDRVAMEKLTTPERIDQMQTHKALRNAQMQKRADAIKTFYAALNASQKKVFDAATVRGMHGMTREKRYGDGQHAHH